MGVEEEGDDDDAVSLGSAHSSSQLPSASQPSTYQAGSSQIREKRPKAWSTTGVRVNEAILKLAGHMALNTSVQDQLASAVQEGSNEWLAFFQWMGLEVCMQLVSGAVDRFHAGLIPDDHPPQAAPHTAASTLYKLQVFSYVILSLGGGGIIGV